MNGNKGVWSSDVLVDTVDSYDVFDVSCTILLFYRVY